MSIFIKLRMYLFNRLKMELGVSATHIDFITVIGIFVANVAPNYMGLIIVIIKIFQMSNIWGHIWRLHSCPLIYV